MNRLSSRHALVSYRSPCATRTSRRGVRVLIEAVEGRILFSNPMSQFGDPAVGTLKDLDGNVMGSSALVDGLLTVNGTDAGEEIVLGMAQGDPTKAYVRIVRRTIPNVADQSLSATFVYDRTALMGIVVNAGAGDDYLDFLSFGRALDLPVTLNGGAGDDAIEGNGIAWDDDNPNLVVDRTDIGVVTHGDDGDDTLYASDSPDTLDGGAGDDLILTIAPEKIGAILPSHGDDILRVYTQSGFYDIPLNTQAPNTQVPNTHAPLTSDDPTTPAPKADAAVPMAPPMSLARATPFATNSLLVTDHKLWEA